jgi:hypothetical protein
MYDGIKSFLMGELIGILFIVIGFAFANMANAVYVGWLMILFGVASLVAMPIVLGCFWLLTPKQA